MKDNEVFVKVVIDLAQELYSRKVRDIQVYKGDRLDRQFPSTIVEHDLKGIMTVTMPVEITNGTAKKRRRKK
tara:strand:- start:10056 stop:10271 length:216 start_codon:yes stop_codon:yes gene_type:complete